MLDAITGWFGALFVAVFKAAWDLITDLAIAVFDLLLTAVAAVLGAIPLPDFITGGANALFAGLDGAVVYLLVHGGIVSAAALIGAGYSFRMLRKFVTLFQW